MPGTLKTVFACEGKGLWGTEPRLGFLLGRLRFDFGVQVGVAVFHSDAVVKV